MKPYFETIWILSHLLHYANLSASGERFYALKNRLLDRYGTRTGYDVQYIGGKECYTCGGTGIYTGFYWSSGEKWTDTCNRCWGDGWYKNPVWNVLLKRRFGKFVFHTPVERCRSLRDLHRYLRAEDIEHLFDKNIEGYVSHRYSRWSDSAAIILFLIFDREYLKRPSFHFGSGWRCSWWFPFNWLNNILHLFHFRFRSIPAQNIRDWFRNRFRREKADLRVFDGEIFDDFPF